MMKSSKDQAPPEGFRYRPEVLAPAEEEELVAQLRTLSLKGFESHGYAGKRRVLSYGWHYDFADRALRATDAVPAFLLGARERAAEFAEIDPADLPHALITGYGPGAAIGWHRDKAVFGDVIGISLLSPCAFRLRRKAGTKWERYSLIAEPRSAYLLHGNSRSEGSTASPPSTPFATRSPSGASGKQMRSRISPIVVHR